MNRRLMTVLMFAFVLALGCSLVVYRIVGKQVAGKHVAQVTRVVAAATDLKLGTILSATNLTTIEISGQLPKGAIATPDKAIGRGVVADIYQGEPILDSRLAPEGSGGGLAATIHPGMRACAVKVDEVVGVAGFVTPGMRVDVLVSGDPPGNPNPKEGTKVETLLQNIEVLSAGTDIQKDNEGKPQQVHVVNLLVTPEQAEKLSLASNHTQIQLVLRNPLDTQVADVASTAMGNIFDTAGPGTQNRTHSGARIVRKEVAAAPASVSVEVLNGAQRTEQKFAVPEAKKE
ncbi:MAG TPA: Flp pilus assembly protein CpaB [Terracidiphilus sp.]|nr:Flp pilus assembly protein CpaB [Terracidiphilus sp.]